MQKRMQLGILRWCGYLRQQYWMTFCGVMYGCIFWCLLVVLVLPGFDPMLDSSARGLRIEELEQRKLMIKQLLARMHEEQGAQAQEVQVPSSVDNVLELIQTGARSARVKVNSLSSEPHNRNAHGDQAGAPYRFGVHGSYFALTRFIETVSQTTNGLLLSELTIHNSAWPDFSGLLEAEVTLQVNKGP